MRTHLTILLLAGMISTAYSQQSRVWVIPSIVLKSTPRDTIIEKLKELLQKNGSPIDHMPNAISPLKPLSQQQVYKGNNGIGFDIYESKIDHMPVLMPDSANEAMTHRRVIKN